MTEYTIKEKCYSNGNIYQRMEYKDGIKHGNDIMYFAYPIPIKWKTPYINGRRHGVEYEYNQNGSVIYTAHYLYGYMVTKEEYHRHKLIEQLSGVEE